MMKAKEVYSILTPAIAACCRVNGFEPVDRTKKAWYRGGKDRFLIFRTRLDVHFGYITGMGGRLFLRGWVSEYLLSSPDFHDEVLGPNQLLPEHWLRRIKELNDAVAAKIPQRPSFTIHSLSGPSLPEQTNHSDIPFQDAMDYPSKAEALLWNSVRWAKPR